MVISSRTPEGDPNRCPICGYHCRLEPSQPSRDGPCPRCGHLLWFEETAVPDAERLRMALVRVIEVRFGSVPQDLQPRVAALVQRKDCQQVFERALTVASLAELLAER